MTHTMSCLAIDRAGTTAHAAPIFPPKGSTSAAIAVPERRASDQEGTAELMARSPMRATQAMVDLFKKGFRGTPKRSADMDTMPLLHARPTSSDHLSDGPASPVLRKTPQSPQGSSKAKTDSDAAARAFDELSPQQQLKSLADANGKFSKLGGHGWPTWLRPGSTPRNDFQARRVANEIVASGQSGEGLYLIRGPHDVEPLPPHFIYVYSAVYARRLLMWLPPVARGAV